MKRRGFSLVETLITASLMAVIAGAVMGVMSIAVRASGVHDPVDAESEVRARIDEELSRATRIVSIDPHAIKFEVADHTGDGVAEMVEYSWSGNSEDALLRTWNDVVRVVVLRDVREFSTVVVANRKREQLQSLTVSSDNKVLSRHRASNPDMLTLDSGEEVTFEMRPAFGARARTWRPTMLKLMLESVGLRSGSFEVSMYRVNANGRASQPIARTIISESNLPAELAYVEIPISATSAIEPQDGLSIVIGGADIASVVRVALQRVGVADRNGRLSVREFDQLQAHEYPSGSLVYELSGLVSSEHEADLEVLRGSSVEVAVATERSRLSTVVPLFASPIVPECLFVREVRHDIEDPVLATGGGG